MLMGQGTTSFSHTDGGCLTFTSFKRGTLNVLLYLVCVGRGVGGGA